MFSLTNDSIYVTCCEKLPKLLNKCFFFFFFFFFSIKKNWITRGGLKRDVIGQNVIYMQDLRKIYFVEKRATY